MRERGADEALVRREELELTLHQREELLFQRRAAQAPILPDGGDRMVDLLLQEGQRDVLLAAEIVEDRPLGDARTRRDRTGSGLVEAARAKEVQGRGEDPRPGRRFLLRPAAGRLRARAGSRAWRSGC